MRLILIRHGESVAELRRVISGTMGCGGLTSRGLEQAKLLAQRVAGDSKLTGCDALLTSPLLRARQTAEIIHSVMPDRPIIEEPRLRELDPGVADGLEWHEYVAKYGEFDLPSNPSRPFAPGGESWNDVTGRVGSTMAHLAKQYQDGVVLAVTHSGFIVLSLMVLFDIPRPGTRAHIQPGHASLTEWRFQGMAWQLARYNDTCHLSAGME